MPCHHIVEPCEADDFDAAFERAKTRLAAVLGEKASHLEVVDRIDVRSNRGRKCAVSVTFEVKEGK